MVTQDPTSHRTMDLYDNLASSASPNYSSAMTPDDLQEDSQFYQVTQPSGTFMPPLDAGMPMTHPSTSDDFRQAEIPDIQPSGHYDYTSRGPTPLSSTDSQSDGSETSFYASSTRNSISPGPTPDTSHTYKIRRPVPQRERLSISPSTLGTQYNQFPDGGHSCARPRASRSSRPFPMPSPPSVQGGVGIPVGAGSYAGAPQSPPAFLGLAPETAQSIQLHVSSNIRSFSPPVPQHQSQEHAPSSLPRPFSVDDTGLALNPQVGPLAQHALENNWQFTQGEYAPFPGSSLAASSGQYHAAQPEYMIPGPSSHTQRGSLASLYSEDSFPSSPSSGLQGVFVSDTTPFLGQASPDTPSQITGNALPQQGTSESSSAPGVSQRKRRTGTRKRNPNPKDPKAAQRLQKQRQTNDQYIDSLFEEFVPSSEGTLETVAKKDRLRLGVYYAKAHKKSRDGSIQRVRTVGNSLNRSGESSNYQG